jgi:hypothetical protein
VRNPAKAGSPHWTTSQLATLPSERDRDEDLLEVCAGDHRSAKVETRGFDPHLLGYLWIVCRLIADYNPRGGPFVRSLSVGFGPQ